MWIAHDGLVASEAAVAWLKRRGVERIAIVAHSLGAAMSFDYWLTHTAECGVPAPDVVYGVGLFTSVTGLAGKYRLVYQQPDVPIAPDSDHLRGPATSAAQFIAVRNDLLPLPPIP